MHARLTPITVRGRSPVRRGAVTGRGALAATSPADPARVAEAFGWARVGFAVGFFTVPALLGRLLGMDRRTAGRTGWLTRMVAGRELAIGLVSLGAVKRGDLTGAFVPQLVADGGDTLALAAAIRRGDVNRPLGLLVALAAVAGVVVEAGAVRAARAAHRS